MMVYIFDIRLIALNDFVTQRHKVTGVANLNEAYKKALDLVAGKYVDQIQLADRYRE
jgi:hypothetical protein